MQLLRFKNRTPARFRVHLLHLISIMSFKLGHVPIPKRRIFLPLFLFCVQRRSCIYAVTPWRTHRQVKKKNKKIKKCIVNFNSIINISLIRHTSYFCMVVMWWTSRADALYTFKMSISSCGPCVRTLTKPRRWQSSLHPSCGFSLS
jgi:hypothetical protein